MESLELSACPRTSHEKVLFEFFLGTKLFRFSSEAIKLTSIISCFKIDTYIF